MCVCVGEGGVREGVCVELCALDTHSAGVSVKGRRRVTWLPTEHCSGAADPSLHCMRYPTDIVPSALRA